MPADILIIDDNRDAAELLSDLLDLQGYTVRIAHSGSEALQRMAQRPASLFLVDQQLPDMLGTQLVPQLRAAAAGRPCIAIAITGLGVADRAQLTGFDHVLAKPLAFDAFDALIAACVAQLTPPGDPSAD
ncbi:response regulator [Acidovorax sp. NCPPB 3576]|uniref:response regulator n=1 Tax=Acidovorax sp. NCPPB 3576 TaxID=2940488 RepID=UPI00234A4CA2|nr:response regulator [Acidovorax sp. NCPPB 3576]WCM86476.1 response regulator [Acidovorax sp. NCPPB 3576]